MLLISLLSCGKRDDPSLSGNEELSGSPVIETNELLSSQGCSLFLLSHPDILSVTRCESGEVYLHYNDGSIEVEINIDISEYLENVFEFPDVNYVCEDHERLINGSFEDGHSLGNNQWNTFAVLPGWIAEESADAPIEIQNGDSIGGIAASHGSAKLELDSHHNRNGFSQSNTPHFTNNNDCQKPSLSSHLRLLSSCK